MSLVGLRAAALAAALVLAVLSRGDAIALAALLAVGAWRPLPAMAIVSALTAAAWRWSSTALEDIAGAQAVLGPAGVVDPATAAVAAWLGALAFVLATPDLRPAYLRWVGERYGHPSATSERGDFTERSAGRLSLVVVGWLPVLAFAAAAALVVAGPAPGGDVWTRVLAGAVAVGLVVLIRGRVRPGGRGRRRLEGAAAVLGLGSLVAVAIDAPDLDGVLDAHALVEGIGVAVAVGALAWTVGAVVVHHPQARADA